MRDERRSLILPNAREENLCEKPSGHGMHLRLRRVVWVCPGAWDRHRLSNVVCICTCIDIDIDIDIDMYTHVEKKRERE